MPYTSPPSKIENMPGEAQRIWMDAFNNAWKTHPDDEAYCNAAAYTAIKNAGYKERDGRWIKESAMKDSKSYWTDPNDVEEIAVLEEAAEGAKTPRLAVTVIREGFSANHYQPFTSRRHKYQLYYTKQAVNDVARLIEDKPAYIGAPDEHGGFRSLRDNVVGVFENSRVENDEGGKALARSDIAVYPDHKWIIERARTNRRAFGPSIEGDPAQIVRGKMDGRDAAIVESVKNIYGALLVVNPAAGGALDSIRESEQKQGGKKMELSELTEAERKELKESVRAEVMAELDVKAKDDEIKTLKESVEKLEKEKADSAAVLAEAKSRELLEKAFPEDLPQAAKDRLYESCKGETDPDKLAEAVKAEAAYIAEVSGGVKITGAPAAPDAKKGDLTEAKDMARDALGLKPPAEKK